MNKNTKKAIKKRLSSGQTRFYIGKYFYEANVNGMIRRREQKPGYMPISDWQFVCKWDSVNREIV